MAYIMECSWFNLSSTRMFSLGKEVRGQTLTQVLNFFLVSCQSLDLQCLYRFCKYFNLSWMICFADKHDSFVSVYLTQSDQSLTVGNGVLRSDTTLLTSFHACSCLERAILSHFLPRIWWELSSYNRLL